MLLFFKVSLEYTVKKMKEKQGYRNDKLSEAGAFEKLVVLSFVTSLIESSSSTSNDIEKAFASSDKYNSMFRFKYL